MSKRYKVLLTTKGCEDRFFDDYNLALKFASRSVESGTSRHAIVKDVVEDRLLVWYISKEWYEYHPDDELYRKETDNGEAKQMEDRR